MPSALMIPAEAISEKISCKLMLARWAALRLALLPEGNVTVRQFPQMDNGALLAVGPEGGFSDNDIALLKQANFHGLRLGPRVLRTETAGLAALAALQASAGDFV